MTNMPTGYEPLPDASTYQPTVKTAYALKHVAEGDTPLEYEPLSEAQDRRVRLFAARKLRILCDADDAGRFKFGHA